MRKAYFVAICGLLLLATPAAAETRALARFDTIEAEGKFQVEVAIGPAFSVRVEGPDAARIATRVANDKLTIEPARRPWFGEPSYNAVIRVTMPRLEAIAAARGARVNANGAGDCPDFSAVAAMGGELRIAGLQCGAVEAVAAMGGELTLAGTCRTLDVTAAMGGVVSARGLECRTVEADAAMGGEIAAFAAQSYNASAVMGGDVNVAGGGKPGDREAVMGGDVSERP
jgi:Putative auto-transporter adhesin, head GIN domain